MKTPPQVTRTSQTRNHLVELKLGRVGGWEREDFQMAVSTDQIDRTGIHAVATIFTDLGWAFREQPTSDYGIDAQAEKLRPGGKAGGS